MTLWQVGQWTFSHCSAHLPILLEHPACLPWSQLAALLPSRSGSPCQFSGQAPVCRLDTSPYASAGVPSFLDPLPTSAPGLSPCSVQSAHSISFHFGSRPPGTSPPGTSPPGTPLHTALKASWPGGQSRSDTLWPPLSSYVTSCKFVPQCSYLWLDITHILVRLMITALKGCKGCQLPGRRKSSESGRSLPSPTSVPRDLVIC